MTSVHNENFGVPYSYHATEGPSQDLE